VPQEYTETVSNEARRVMMNKSRLLACQPINQLRKNGANKNATIETSVSLSLNPCWQVSALQLAVLQTEIRW